MNSRQRQQGGVTGFSLILLLGWLAALFPGGGTPVNPPKHLRPDINWEAITESHPELTFLNPDTSITHKLHLLRDKEETPLLYYADLHTPVCIDGVCKPVFLEMYWDLLGNYVGFGEYPDRPLTKYDHDPFTAEDYAKLHSLLLDRNSILDRKSLDDLYDLRQASGEKIAFNGVEIDGISGATKTEIKSSVVSGALYSCYRLWYLAQGDAREKILSHLPEIYDEALAHRFLGSEQAAFRYYAIRQMDGADFLDFAPILEVFRKGNPLTRKHILKKLPDSLLQRPSVFPLLYQMFPDLDSGSKTLLLEKLPLAPAAAPKIAPHIKRLTKNQLISYLDFLRTTKLSKNRKLRKQLKLAARDDGFVYDYLIEGFLDE